MTIYIADNLNIIFQRTKNILLQDIINITHSILLVNVWQGRQDSNLQPTVLETATLPIELRPYSTIISSFPYEVYVFCTKSNTFLILIYAQQFFYSCAYNN